MQRRKDLTPHEISIIDNDGKYPPSHNATSIIKHDPVWPEGLKCNIHVMSDGRIQVFKASPSSQPNLRIYNTLDEVFEDFQFSKWSSDRIKSRYRIILNSYQREEEVVS